MEMLYFHGSELVGVIWQVFGLGWLAGFDLGMELFASIRPSQVCVTWRHADARRAFFRTGSDTSDRAQALQLAPD